MTQTKYFNPQQIASTIMSKSFLKKRQSQRQKGTGSQFFQDNKIRSCSYVREGKGGLQAVPFYDRRNEKVYPTQSAVKRSWNQSVHCNKSLEHAGGGFNKTLTGYNINTERNLMSIPDFKPPYPNSSHIQIGDRAKKDGKHFVSTYQNDMIFRSKDIQTNHPGIQAFKNKWLKSRLQK